MDLSERLAALAAGDLAPDDAASLEAELARDPALRAEYDAIVEVDQLLASLPEVAPSATFQAGLRDNLRAELADHAAVVSLDEARARRARWLRPVSAVAAAAAVVGVVGIGLANLTGAQDADQDPALFGAAEADAGLANEAAGDHATLETARAPAQPVYAEGGAYDDQSLAGLARRQDIRAALAQAALDPAFSQDQFLQILSAAASVSTARQGAQEPSAAAPPPPEADGATLADSVAEPVAVGAAVDRCIPQLLDEDRVPLFADLGTFDGTAALVVVLGSRDADGNFERLEFWALAHEDDCAVLFFSQSS